MDSSFVINQDPNLVCKEIFNKSEIIEQYKKNIKGYYHSITYQPAKKIIDMYVYYTCPAALATYSLDKDGNIKIYNTTIDYYTGLLDATRYCPSRHQIPTTIEEYKIFPYATDSDIDANGDCIEQCPEPTLNNRQARANNPSCIPCPVEPLKPITDPIVLALEKDPVQESKLNPDMYAKTQCLKKAASAAGITFKVESAWRPQPYQDHLFDIYQKMTKLDKNMKNPACKPVYDSVEAHRAFHKVATKQTVGRRPVAIKSKHPDGDAIDASWNSSDAKIDQVAATCGLCRPYKNPKVKGYDRPHFQVCK